MATQTAPSATSLDSGEMLRIRNEEDKVLDIVFERKRYVVEPGQTGLVPFALVCHFWGDPRSRFGEFGKFSDSKERGWVPKREDELKRLGGKYGTYSEDIEVLNAEEWDPHSPFVGTSKARPHRVSIQTDDGKVVIPVCFDTSGEAVYPAIKNDSEDLNDQQTRYEHLMSQMDKLKEQMRTLQGISSDDAEVDAGR